MAKAGKKNGKGTIVVRREEVVEGGHHGGAWKVAYADFVTAMMAFFLLMWLLNATTEEQRKGLADYFSPTSVLSHGSSGTGQPFGGRTAFEQGTMISNEGSVQVIVGKRPTVEDPDEDQDSDTPAAPVRHSDADIQSPKDQTMTAAPGAPAQAAARTGAGMEAAEAARRAAEEQARAESRAMERAADQIRDAVRADPALAAVARQLSVDMTPEGLRIQILDEDRQPMFPTGSAAANDRAKLLLQKIAPVLMSLKEDISISGYTDAAPFKGGDRTNWELSADRANGTRRLLVEGGLPAGRIRSVTGNADREPLLPDDPLAAANRRIAIVVLRAAPVPPPVPAPVPGGASGPAGAGAAAGGAHAPHGH